MNDKQLAEFEKWAEGSYVLDKSRYGEYMAVKTNIAWKAWQAALSSVVIELPESYGIGEVYPPAMLSALDEAGIRYE